MTTESELWDWRFGAIEAERLCAGLLEISGYTDVDPQSTLGGPDGKKDILARKARELFVAAVYFPPTRKTFKEIQAKFRRDRAGVELNGAAGLVFFVNQPLTGGERAALRELGGENDEIFHLERIRHLLDSPPGYGLRQKYLRIEMTPAEDAALQSLQQRATSRGKSRRQEVGRESSVLAFPELGAVRTRLPEAWDDRPELTPAPGGIGQLELVLYDLLQIDEQGDVLLDADANDALVPEESAWWREYVPTRALSPAEDIGVASEYLATVPSLGGVAVTALTKSIAPLAEALADVDFWRHGPRCILRSWRHDYGLPCLAVANAALAGWANEAASGLLLYVDGSVIDQVEGMEEVPGPLHSYLLCLTRSGDGTDGLGAIHRLVLSCPGESWCRVGGCDTPTNYIEMALSPFLATAAKSAQIASAAHQYAEASVYEDVFGSGGDDTYAEPFLEIIVDVLQQNGWKEVERGGWEGGMEELVLRRADDFLRVDHDPVTRQIRIADGTGNVDLMLQSLSDEGLITESGNELVLKSEQVAEQWGSEVVAAATDALSGRIDLDRPPAFAPVQATMLGLHPFALGAVASPTGESLYERQLRQLLRTIDTRR
jgi:hypothetical protein